MEGTQFPESGGDERYIGAVYKQSIAAGTKVDKKEQQLQSIIMKTNIDKGRIVKALAGFITLMMVMKFINVVPVENLENKI